MNSDLVLLPDFLLEIFIVLVLQCFAGIRVRDFRCGTSLVYVGSVTGKSGGEKKK